MRSVCRIHDTRQTRRAHTVDTQIRRPHLLNPMVSEPSAFVNVNVNANSFIHSTHILDTIRSQLRPEVVDDYEKHVVRFGIHPAHLAANCKRSQHRYPHPIVRGTA